jgi:two-component system cell cycle sensor histidine kinase/response regulator CckA
MIMTRIDYIFQDILDAIREPLLVLDSDLKVILANRSFINSFKVTPEETLGNFIYDLGNQQWDIPKLRELLEGILPKNNTFDSYEIEHEFPNIGHKIMLLNARRFTENDTGSQMIFLAIEDISERMQLETLLKDSEERFRRLFETANDGILLLEKREFKICHVNPAVTAMLDYSKEECIGNDIKDIGFPDDLDTPQEILKTLNKDGIIHYKDVPVRKKAGQVIDTDIYMVDKATLVQCNIRNVTERKRTEEALRKSEEKYRRLFNNAEVGIYRTRLDGSEVIEVNRKFLDIAGATREEIIGKPSVNLWADPKEREEMAKMLVTDGSVSAFEFKMLNKRRGDVRNCLTSALLYREQGILEGSIVDITDRIHIEQSLQEEKNRAQSYLDIAEVMFVVINSKEEVALTNRKTCEVLGYKQEEIIAKNWFDSFLPARIKDQVRTVFAGLMAGEIGHFRYYENTVLTKDGKERDIAWQSTILKDDEGNIFGILASGEDITDLKQAEKEKQRLEAQLQQSQKMETIGLLAGGIAHDFNNLLTTIIGNAYFALDQASEGTSLYNEIDEIRKAGRQAAALTRQLLAFSRKQLIKPQVINLNDILMNTEKMLRRTIGEDIEFKTTFEPELWNVKMDSGQIEQIILNLIVNARDAMPDGGNLTVETANVELDDMYFQNHGIKNGWGSYVMMAVTDTGIGMDEETQSRIFEPFFTTKERAQGTGLGLSTVYGIVKQNNGHIWAYSEPGKGTTLKVYFPRIKADEASDIEEQLDENRLKGSETILIVEDSETLLKLTQKMLESYGYKVLTAQNGNEAMEIFNGHDGPIHLLLTDVVMPGMSGRKLAEQIQSENQKVKVIYMSGYTDDTISKHGVLNDDIEFIEKPYSAKDLGLKVRKVLTMKRTD